MPKTILSKLKPNMLLSHASVLTGEPYSNKYLIISPKPNATPKGGTMRWEVECIDTDGVATKKIIPESTFLNKPIWVYK